MNRDELLTKLAMELAEWPKHAGQVGRFYFIPSAQYYGPEHPDSVVTTSGLTSRAWLARRAELINEPDDADAPDNVARYRTQDANGEWWWHELKPFQVAGPDVWDSDGWQALETLGKIPAGHRWQDTLKEVSTMTTTVHEDQYATEPRTTFEVSTPEEEAEFNRIQARQDAESPHQTDARHLDEQLERDMRAFREVYKIAEDQDAAEFGLPNANSILNAAAQHMQDRAATYDKPQGERSMAATVEAFNAVTGDGLMNTEERGWLFMQLLKAVRSQQGAYRADSYEDGAAYAALAGEAAAKHR